jgi:hypothetical protein
MSTISRQYEISEEGITEVIFDSEIPWEWVSPNRFRVCERDAAPIVLDLG